jgi:hypothetical protein
MDHEPKDIEEIYRKMLMNKTGEERLLMGFSMFRFSTKLLLNGLKEKISSKKLKKYIFLKIYGNDFDKDELEKILSSISQ